MLAKRIVSGAKRESWRWIINGARRDISRESSSPSLSIWRRKKEMGKEGLFVVKELKRLQKSASNGVRLENFLKLNVSRLVRTDLLAVLAELQRQDLVFLSLKIYEIVRREIWYRPDMFFFRDMLMMLAKNNEEQEARRVWKDMMKEGVLFDQHTFGDLVRAFCDGGLPDFAMDVYSEMRRSPDPPLSLPFRVMLKGLLRYPKLREKVKGDFLELFPGMVVCDPLDEYHDDGDDDSNDDADDDDDDDDDSDDSNLRQDSGDYHYSRSWRER